MDLFPNEPKLIKLKSGEKVIVRHLRETSIQAKREVEEEGLPSSVRGDLMSIIKEMSIPLTVGELTLAYRRRFPNSKRARNELAKRVSELKDVGLIREMPKRRCELTGKLVLTFERS